MGTPAGRLWLKFFRALILNKLSHLWMDKAELNSEVFNFIYSNETYALWV
jgi:hypothetical protein